MRIGVIGPDGPDLFADNIRAGLARMGHEAFLLGAPRLGAGRPPADAFLSLAQRSLPSVDAFVQRRLLKRARAHACDLVINVDPGLDASVVAALRGHGIRTCYWFPDAVVNLGRFSAIVAPYDALFFKEPILIERLRAMLDLPVFYLPEACNPVWHRPPEGLPVSDHIVVVGNMYPSRTLLLRRLVDAGLNLRLYGGGFPRWLKDDRLAARHAGRYVRREEKAAIFRSAAAVLNNLHPGEISGVNQRLFEATACGAAVLTEWRPSLPELFEEGKEVLAFRDFDELLEKARFLLANPDRGRAMGDAASARAHAEHGYEERLSVMFDCLGL